ncbi:MAG: Transcriptional regulator, LysR family, partial [uncultured Ramlibacter sp.]
GSDPGDAGICPCGGVRQLHARGGVAGPAQGLGDQAGAAARGAPAGAPAQSHHAPRHGHGRWCGLLRTHLPAAERPRRHRSQHVERAGQSQRPHPRRRGHLGGARAGDPRARRLLPPLSRDPVGPGRDRPSGGPDQRQRGLRDPRRRAAGAVAGGAPRGQHAAGDGGIARVPAAERRAEGAGGPGALAHHGELLFIAHRPTLPARVRARWRVAGNLGPLQAGAQRGERAHGRGAGRAGGLAGGAVRRCRAPGSRRAGAGAAGVDAAADPPARGLSAQSPPQCQGSRLRRVGRGPVRAASARPGL